jgi:hypothetical protein
MKHRLGDLPAIGLWLLILATVLLGIEVWTRDGSQPVLGLLTLPLALLVIAAVGRCFKLIERVYGFTDEHEIYTCPGTTQPRGARSA